MRWAATTAACVVVGVGGCGGSPPPPGPTASAHTDTSAPGVMTFDVPVAQPVALALAGPALFVAGRGSARSDRTSGLGVERPAIVRMSVKRARPLGRPVAIGSRPGDVAIIQGEAVMWVTHKASRSLRLMDPGTGLETIGSIPGLSEPVAVAVGYDSVWVAGSGPVDERGEPGGYVKRAKATAGRFSATIGVGRAPADLTASRSGVWVTNSQDDTVTRIDPSTNRPVRTISVGDRPMGITAARDGVWVANHGDDTISEINPDKNQVVATIAVGRAPRGIAHGRGSVWVTNELDDTVTRISAQTDRVTSTVAVGAGPAGIVYGRQAVWVANRLGRSVTRIQP